MLLVKWNSLRTKRNIYIFVIKIVCKKYNLKTKNFKLISNKTNNGHFIYIKNIKKYGTFMYYTDGSKFWNDQNIQWFIGDLQFYGILKRICKLEKI